MEKPLLAYTLWLSYSEAQREKLRRLFDIPRTGESVVHVGEIVSGNIGGVQKQDGHRAEDLYAITIERIYELLNDEVPEDPNFYAAFHTLMEHLDDIYYEHYPDTKPETDVEAVAPIPNPVVSATQDAELQQDFVPRDPEELIKPKTEGNAKATKTRSTKAK